MLMATDHIIPIDSWQSKRLVEERGGQVEGDAKLCAIFKIIGTISNGKNRNSFRKTFGKVSLARSSVAFSRGKSRGGYEGDVTLAIALAMSKDSWPCICLA